MVKLLSDPKCFFGQDIIDRPAPPKSSNRMIFNYFFNGDDRLIVCRQHLLRKIVVDDTISLSPNPRQPLAKSKKGKKEFGL